MARGEPVLVMGIWLRREGDHVVVLAEDTQGNSIEVIREWYDGAFSHNVSEHGIRGCFEKHKK